MHFNSSEDIQRETSHLSLFLSSTETSLYLTEVNSKFLSTPMTPGFFPYSSALYLKVFLLATGSMKVQKCT